MKFDTLFDYHKKPNWKDFYLEYNELREYLINARNFFRESKIYLI